MIMCRNSIEGQSLYIGLGALAAYGCMLADGIQTLVVYVLYAVVFCFELFYVWQIYSLSGKQGVNLWCRA